MTPEVPFSGRPTPEVWAVVRSPEDLGAFVARLRFTHDLTQAELAERLGISRRYVYEIESGRPNLYALRLFEILNLLGATMTVVHDRKDDPDNGQGPVRRPGAGEDHG